MEFKKISPGIENLAIQNTRIGNVGEPRHDLSVVVVTDGFVLVKTD